MVVNFCIILQRMSKVNAREWLLQTCRGPARVAGYMRHDMGAAWRSFQRANRGFVMVLTAAELYAVEGQFRRHYFFGLSDVETAEIPDMMLPPSKSTEYAENCVKYDECTEIIDVEGRPTNIMIAETSSGQGVEVAKTNDILQGIVNICSC